MQKRTTRRVLRILIYPAIVLGVAATLGLLQQEQPVTQLSVEPNYMEKSKMPENYLSPEDPDWIVTLSEEQWKERLEPKAFEVLCMEGTEPPFRNAYDGLKEDGRFVCGGCNILLFDSQQKYDSGTGWPSFFAPINPDYVGTQTDRSLFTPRTEVHCARCKGHLGHVFDDGPQPTGLRYCLNSASIVFVPRDEALPEPLISTE